ncbi:PAP2 superfamily protein [Trichomonas vaginalis G3]|uniref:PAP2 superfamily protein n=1 Tax=Trichomonas vaginalis (strain ATCC PRA-98 / G3) TaxID=412133 RepID=A2ES10_TRIV3|nr:phosphatidate phosphatase protein [Trichomonas vaginalis G3]EAY04522.1 PAP2 superfamily protein [Trichomonas vaginalis G3]KAI5508456.1 phosphatidate phosphatase protein [Trichomonas vaginalis G3]|eukprot:XP_001316745.1 PAP2 superfamily protein [Trichomonas vaginalis G3]
MKEYVKNNWKKLDIPNMIIAGMMCSIYEILFYFVNSDPLYVPPEDSNSQFPYRSSTVAFDKLMLYQFFIYFFSIIAAYLLQRFFPRFFRKFRPFTLAWNIVTIEFSTGIIISIFKNYVGRARPNVFDSCNSTNVNGGKSNCPKAKTDEYYYESFRSWPSVHSQMGVSGMTVLGLFIQRLIKTKNMFGILISSAPILYGFYVGATIIRDFKHHPDDVLAGFVVGFVWALIGWDIMNDSIFKKSNNDQYFD